MKKLAIVIAVALALGLGLPTNALAAVPKAGASCAKAGITQTASGKKFTCVKSGKKLVWNKGAVVKASPAPTATPVISLDNLPKDWTTKAAQAAVLAKLSGLPQPVTVTELIAAPNVSASQKSLELELVNQAPRLFQEYYSPDVFTVILFSERDGDWADEQFTKYGLQYMNEKVSTSIKNLNGRPCNFAGVNFNVDKKFFECTPWNKTREALMLQTPVHEYFHLVQSSMIHEMQVPAWMIEGSAAFFGEIVGYRNERNPLSLRLDMNINSSRGFDPDDQGQDEYRFRYWAATAKTTDVVKLFKKLEVRRVDNGNKLAWYTVGSIATEALVASFGFDGYMKVWTYMSRGQAFADAFKQAFGLTPEEFYVKLTPFINVKF